MDYTAIKNAALVALIVVAVGGILLAIILKKILGKIISLVLAAVLVVVFFQQRQHITDSFNSAVGKAEGRATAEYCNTHPSFLGLQVTLPGCS